MKIDMKDVQAGDCIVIPSQRHRAKDVSREGTLWMGESDNAWVPERLAFLGATVEREPSVEELEREYLEACYVLMDNQTALNIACCDQRFDALKACRESMKAGGA